MAVKKKKKAVSKTAFEKLNDKNKLFVKNYIKRMGNATKAYMDTYPKIKYNSARTKGCDLLTKVDVIKAVEEEYAKVYAKILTETEKSKTYQMIMAISDASIEDFIDLEDGTLRVKDLENIPEESLHAIQAIEQDEKSTDTSYNKNIKIKLHPKLQALKMRAEIQKLIDPKAEVQQVEIIITPAKRPEAAEEN